MNFNDNIIAVLESYHTRMEEEALLMQQLPIEEGMKRRDEFLLPVGKEVAQFLNTLIKSAGAKHILEIGTSYGYSTVWLAEAAQATAGKVITLEIDKQKVSYAQQKIEEAGLSEVVEFRIGDACEQIRKTGESFDFVLIDIWKELYVPCFELVYPKLQKGAFIVADNIIHPPFHKEETTAYRHKVKEKGALDTILLPIGSGIEVSYLI